MNNINLQYNELLLKANKSLRLLNSSLSKYSKFISDKEYSDDELEQFDALSDRFLRCTEMCLRLIRTWELLNFGENALTLRDTLNRAEKSGLIASTSEWMNMRQIRNRIAHDYLPEEIGFYYQMINDEYSKHLIHLIEFLSKK
ncbi:MAG TPA: nucleotidyltransferase substrate binding protein [Candidatus Kapabacteria bacterium]|nr:nucleotidyltransferase substrate binding protein [Candidatus Kapabacteria bacterium]